MKKEAGHSFKLLVFVHQSTHNTSQKTWFSKSTLSLYRKQDRDKCCAKFTVHKSDNIHCIVSKMHISETAGVLYIYILLQSPHITKSPVCFYLYNWVYLLYFWSCFLYKHCGTDVHKAELSALPSLTSRLHSCLYCMFYWAYKNVFKPIGLVRFDRVHSIMKNRKIYWT
jgi:hypothetical protein